MRDRLALRQWFGSDAGNDGGHVLEDSVYLGLAACGDHVERNGLCGEQRSARDADLHLGLRPLPGPQPPLRELVEKAVGGKTLVPGGRFKALPELFVDADVLADRPGHGSGPLGRADARTIFREATRVRSGDSCSALRRDQSLAES